MDSSGWPGRWVPDEYVLEETDMLLSSPAETPTVLPFPFIQFSEGIFPEWDFDYLSQQRFFLSPNALLQQHKICEHLLEFGRNCWVSVHFLDEATLHWIKVPVDVACMALFDLLRLQPTVGGDKIYLAGEHGDAWITISKATRPMLQCVSTHSITLSDEHVIWPPWARIMQQRHSNFLLKEWLYSNRDNLSFSKWVTDEWTDVVIGSFRHGTSVEMENTAVTLRLIDAIGHDHGEIQAFTVYDDLARYFYADKPEPWTNHLWEYIDPILLIPDMITQETLAKLQQRRLAADADLLARLRKEGRLFRERGGK